VAGKVGHGSCELESSYPTHQNHWQPDNPNAVEAVEESTDSEGNTVSRDVCLTVTVTVTVAVTRSPTC
jgi:hypothetical protein